MTGFQRLFGALRRLGMLAVALCTLAVPASSVTVQESQAIRGGPAKYWHEVSGYGSDGHMMWTCPNGNSRLNWMEWRSGLPAGRYAVQVFVPRNQATTRHAVYHIKSGGAEIAAKVVDQEAYCDIWVDLGTFDFFGGEPSVLLGDDTGESWTTGRKIGFDAVNFIPVSPPSQPGSADPAIQKAIQKARSYLGKVWTGPHGESGMWCLYFVQFACGTSRSFGTAQAAADYFVKRGKMHTGGHPSQAPLGAWVFFRWGSLGHVGMMSGPALMIHQWNGGKVVESNPDTIARSLPYIGWVDFHDAVNP
jgi:hypothetical protein